MIENNYDASVARSTWRQVATLAKSQGHFLLASRAIGEAGISAFILGDMASAKRDVLAAWGVSRVFHDDAAHVRYATLYGAGLSELHRYKEALSALDDAINTAKKDPAVAYPDLTISLKIDALRGEHRLQEALSLADQAIEQIPNPALKSSLLSALNGAGRSLSRPGQLGSCGIRL